MAISFVGTAYDAIASGTALSVDVSGLSIASGDLVLAFINGNGSRTVSDNNGGTPFAEKWKIYPGTPTCTGFIWYRVAGGSEPSAYAFTGSGSDRWNCVIYVLRGTDVSTIWDVEPSNDTDGAGIGTDEYVCGAITVGNGCMAIAHCWVDINTSDDYTVDNSYTNKGRGELQQPQCAFSRLFATGASTGDTTITNTASSSRGYITQHFSILPLAEAAGVTHRLMTCGAGQA